MVTQADTGGPLAEMLLMTDQKGSSHEWLFICEQMMCDARSSRVPGLAQSLCLSVKLHEEESLTPQKPFPLTCCVSGFVSSVEDPANIKNGWKVEGEADPREGHGVKGARSPHLIMVSCQVAQPCNSTGLTMFCLPIPHITLKKKQNSDN